MAAGKQGPAGVFLLVDGYDMLASGSKNVSHEDSVPAADTTGVGASARTRAPLGVMESVIEQSDVFFDTAARSIHDALASKLPTSPTANVRIVCMGMAGVAAGDPLYGYEGAYNNKYAVKADDGDLQKVDVEYSVSGARDSGRIVDALTTRTADWNTEGASVDHTTDPGAKPVTIVSSSVASPSVITTATPHGLTTGDKVLIAGHAGSTPSINAEHVATVVTTTTFTIPVNVTVGGTGGTMVPSNSAGGGVGYLQVKAISGFTNFVAKVRDSADNTTFADLVTFTDSVTDPHAERKAVAGTVDRYLAVDGNVTGTGSITSLVGFARS